MEINKVSQTPFIGSSEPIVEEKKIVNTDINSVMQGKGEEAYSEKDLNEAAEIVNSLLKKHDSHVEYSMHDKLKNVIMIKIVDSNTGDVLSEIPPKKIIDMVAKMCEMVGIMVDKKA